MSLSRIVRGWLRRPNGLGRNERGAFIVELAVATPVLLMLLLTGIEFTRFVLVNQKVRVVVSLRNHHFIQGITIKIQVGLPAK